MLWLGLVPQPEAVWPVTVVGWVTFVGFLISGGYVAYDRLIAKGKRDRDLDGLGKRVSDVEDWQKRFDAGATERALIQQNIIHTQEELLVKLGEAKAAAEKCGTDTERMTKELTKLIETNHRESGAWERRVSMQLSNLETELRARNILAAQPPSSPPLPRPLPRDE